MKIYTFFCVIIYSGSFWIRAISNLIGWNGFLLRRDELFFKDKIQISTILFLMTSKRRKGSIIPPLRNCFYFVGVAQNSWVICKWVVQKSPLSQRSTKNSQHFMFIQWGNYYINYYYSQLDVTASLIQKVRVSCGYKGSVSRKTMALAASAIVEQTSKHWCQPSFHH